MHDFTVLVLPGAYGTSCSTLPAGPQTDHSETTGAEAVGAVA